jgi:hypothetical protein
MPLRSRRRRAASAAAQPPAPIVEPEPELVAEPEPVKPKAKKHRAPRAKKQPQQLNVKKKKACSPIPMPSYSSSEDDIGMMHSDSPPSPPRSAQRASAAKALSGVQGTKKRPTATRGTKRKKPLASLNRNKRVLARAPDSDSDYHSDEDDDIKQILLQLKNAKANKRAHKKAKTINSIRSALDEMKTVSANGFRAVTEEHERTTAEATEHLLTFQAEMSDFNRALHHATVAFTKKINRLADLQKAKFSEYSSVLDPKEYKRSHQRQEANIQKHAVVCAQALDAGRKHIENDLQRLFPDTSTTSSSLQDYL